MSGRYAHCNGLIGLVNRGWDMPESETTIVDCLNDAGFHTANFGFQHERRDPAHNHYAFEWHESNDAKEVVAQVAAYLDTAPRPFYINAGTSEVHLPFDKPGYVPADPGEVVLPAYLPDTPEVRLEWARFLGAIRYMDEAFGLLLKALARSGRRNDTIVVFTTDHGAAFPRAKSTLYDPGIATALIARFPERFNGVRHELLSNIDLMPTLLEAVGVPVPPSVQGRSFHGLLSGRGYEPNDIVFSEKNFHNHSDPMRAVRTSRYKYLRSFTDQPKLLLPFDIERSIAAKTLRPDAQEPRPREELYDLHQDPNEEINLIDNPALASVREDLARRLEQWMKDTRDPVLDTTDLPYPPEQFA